jgi:hypothetical protein
VRIATLLAALGVAAATLVIPLAARAQAPAQPAQVVPAPADQPRTRLTWDLNLDGALGHAFEGEGHLSGFGRIRGGLLFINEQDLAAPLLLSAGLTYEASDLSLATIGAQGEVLSLGMGGWLQLGAMFDAVRVRPAFMAALGFSLVGAEVQLRGDEQEGTFWAVYGKLRIPVRVIVMAFED